MIESLMFVSSFFIIYLKNGTFVCFLNSRIFGYWNWGFAIASSISTGNHSVFGIACMDQGVFFMIFTTKIHKKREIRFILSQICLIYLIQNQIPITKYQILKYLVLFVFIYLETEPIPTSVLNFECIFQVGS